LMLRLIQNQELLLWSPTIPMCKIADTDYYICTRECLWFLLPISLLVLLFSVPPIIFRCQFPGVSTFLRKLGDKFLLSFRYEQLIDHTKALSGRTSKSVSQILEHAHAQAAR
jgi:hypothetical protein